jgi:hypothetical protein
VTAPIGGNQNPAHVEVHVRTFTDNHGIWTSSNGELKQEGKATIPDVCLSAVSRSEKEDGATDIAQTGIGNRQPSQREMWLNLGGGSERPGIRTIAAITADKCRGDGGGGGDNDTAKAKEVSSAQYRRPSFIPGYSKPFPRVTIV